MKKIIIITIFLISTELFSIENKITLGREDAWSSMRILNNLVLKPGKEAFMDLGLAENEYKPEKETDLLMNFNSGFSKDLGSNYISEVSDYKIFNEKALFGKGSALFEKENKGVFLKAQKGALFSNFSEMSDFSIEFWMNPFSMEEGSSILSWKGFIKDNNDITKQSIEVFISDRKLVWDFKNFFISSNSPGDFLIEGSKKLFEKQASHHLIRYNSQIGLLEYLINGKTENIIYTTASGKEEASVFLPVSRRTSSGSIVLAASFTGLIDEFRISRKYIEDPVANKYKNHMAYGLSDFIDFEMSNSQLINISFKNEIPDDSDIFYYYYISDETKFLNYDDEKWIPYNKISSMNKGRFMQIKVEFFPDRTGEKSPLISEIKLTYEKDIAPQIPGDFNIFPGDKELDLSWAFIAENDVKGYLVYYGDASNLYFGKDADQGLSPINVGNINKIKLTGLENGKLYFVSIVAYDFASPGHNSDFSKELSGRPSRLFKRK